jgi:DNA-binding response OmpR family regulator
MPTNSSLRVLVVDDNHDAADSLGAILEMVGAESRIAYDGNMALAAAVEFRPTIAILDIGLPGMNGLELARRIRDHLPDVKLIALTGWGQEEDRRRSSQAGFDHHFTKPLKIEVLLSLFEKFNTSPESTA